MARSWQTRFLGLGFFVCTMGWSVCLPAGEQKEMIGEEGFRGAQHRYEGAWPSPLPLRKMPPLPQCLTFLGKLVPPGLHWNQWRSLARKSGVGSQSIGRCLAHGLRRSVLSAGRDVSGDRDRQACTVKSCLASPTSTWR